MNTIKSLLMNIRGVLGGVGEVVGYVLIFMRAMLYTKAVLASRLLAAESQLAACKHRIESKKLGTIVIRDLQVRYFEKENNIFYCLTDIARSADTSTDIVM